MSDNPNTAQLAGGPRPEDDGPARSGDPAPAPAVDATVEAGPAPIAAEDDEGIDDTDSSLGIDAASSTASLTSAILQYRTIHGRRYHSETGKAQYWGSNDEAQSEAMDILHHLVTLTLGDQLFLSPISDDVKSAIDIGTGTGTWAIDFADRYPDCQVTGTDVSPIQPTWVPPNLSFAIEDFNQSWTFAPESLDFVHTRYLIGSVPDWNHLFKEAYKTLKPGGWLESLEGSSKLESDDDTLGPAQDQWGYFFVEGGKKIGNSFTVLDDDLQRKAMEAAGFVDIRERNYKCPLGRWPKDPMYKEIGHVGQIAIGNDAEGFVLFMATLLGWSKEEVTVYVAKFRNELYSGKHHAYFRLRSMCGRKPQ